LRAGAALLKDPEGILTSIWERSGGYEAWSQVRTSPRKRPHSSAWLRRYRANRALFSSCRITRCAAGQWPTAKWVRVVTLR